VSHGPSSRDVVATNSDRIAGCRWARCSLSANPHSWLWDATLGDIPHGWPPVPGSTEGEMYLEGRTSWVARARQTIYAEAMYLQRRFAKSAVILDGRGDRGVSATNRGTCECQSETICVRCPRIVRGNPMPPSRGRPHGCAPVLAASKRNCHSRSGRSRVTARRSGQVSRDTETYVFVGWDLSYLAASRVLLATGFPRRFATTGRLLFDRRPILQTTNFGTRFCMEWILFNC